MEKGSTETCAVQRWLGTTWKASPACTYSMMRATIASNRSRGMFGSKTGSGRAPPSGRRDGAAGEGDRLLGRRLTEARDLGRRQRVRVAAVGQRPAHDLARLVADERPA